VPKFAANLTMMFGELPFLDRFAAAKAAGFGGVDYLFPYDFDKAELREQLHQHGLTQVLHNLPAGNWGAGERGIAILPDRVDEFRDGVRRAIDYAKALDCRQLNCLVGITPRDTDPVKLNDVLVGNLRFAADELARERIRLLIEPINTIDIPGFFLNKTEQALQIIADVRSSNLFVQYDIYHMQVKATLREVCRSTWPASRMFSSQTIPAATSPVPARSTIPSCSAISTLLVIAAGSGANTSRGRRRSTASDGTLR
jgi:hydroxypyruvate isomerase